MTSTSRTWGDRAGGHEPGTVAECPYGHISEVRTLTSRLVRCAQCASLGQVTWILVPDGQS
jgi:hypothetical protein